MIHCNKRYKKKDPQLEVFDLRVKEITLFQAFHFLGFLVQEVYPTR